VGFTSLSESRDAEDVRELLSEYFAMAKTVVSRYGGTIEYFIHSTFNVPTMHEAYKYAAYDGLSQVGR
jgi:class 3 adenylate cyclase